MEIGGISKYIKDLIIDHDKVEVPHLGIFYARQHPAHFSENKTVIYPPFRSLAFNAEAPANEDCGLLVRAVAADMQIPEDSAINELEWGTSRILSELDANGVCVLPGLGEVKKSAAGAVEFTAYDDLDISPDSVGLEPVCVKPIPVSEPVWTVPEKPARKQESNRKHNRKRGHAGWIILGVIMLIVLFFVSIYCFRDQLAPFSESIITFIDNCLNHILYNAEERALLGF